MTAGNLVWYFGCYHEAGHHLWQPGRRSVRDFDAKRLKVPQPRDLDGSELYLPHPERVGTGALTYLPACDRTVLAWWSPVFDGRPGCNAAVIVEGLHSAAETWAHFARAFPDLEPRLKFPTLKGASTALTTAKDSDWCAGCGRGWSVTAETEQRLRAELQRISFAGGNVAIEHPEWPVEFAQQLAAVVARNQKLEAAVNRFRYAIEWAGAESWDGTPEMLAKIADASAFAKMHFGALSPDELAKLGKEIEQPWPT
jgi:hypothetical protein